MSDQRYAPPSLPQPLQCRTCHGRSGKHGPVAQDQCKACGGTGVERFNAQQAVRDKLDKGLDLLGVECDKLMFEEINKMTAPSKGSPEAVIANLREVMSTMEMHRFELPEQACQDAIDLIERMGKQLQAWQMSLEGVGWRSRNYYNILMEIHTFLYPPDMTTGGKTYRFNGVDNADEILRILSEKIRAIPERITKANDG